MDKAEAAGKPVTRCLYCQSDELSPVAERADGVGILECGRCGLMMVAALPVDLAKLYRQDYFEKPQTGPAAGGGNIGYADYLSSPAANLTGKYAFARLLAYQSKRHLDLGAADGSLMEVFRDNDIDTTGLEISAEAAAAGQAKGLPVIQSDLSSFPESVADSDLVTAFDLLEHVANPRQVLEQTKTALSKGGHFVFSTLAVTRRDKSEYWFNHSLEHLVYFTDASLTYILRDMFGGQSFAFVRLDINGVAEFWGVARKARPLGRERQLLELVARGGFDIDDVEAGYLLALFYPQAARYAAARKIARHFATEWSAGQRLQAAFYAEYYQGNFQQASTLIDKEKLSGTIHSSVFWQAYAYCRQRYDRARQQAVAEEHAAQDADRQSQIGALNDEIVNLRGQVFRLRDELHTMRNSRVLGKVIRVRDAIGAARPKVRKVRQAPRWALHKTRVVVAPLIPGPVRRPLKRVLKGGRQAAADTILRYQQKEITYRTVATSAWNEKRPLVSVVIPYYNRADTIDETLDSLAVQTLRDFETIIIDDGSPDPESARKFDGLSAHRLRPKLIRQANQGVAAARNNGVRRSRGKYVVCLDSDDMIDPTYLEKAVTLMETSPDTSLVTSHQDMFGVVNELFRKNPYDPLHLYRDNMVITAAAFRRELWQAAGGYKPDIGYEDWEFWLSAAEQGYWGKLLPEALFYYRTSLQSRYVEDKDVHWSNIKIIQELHRGYNKKIKALLAKRQNVRQLVEPAHAFRNLGRPEQFRAQDAGKLNVLIVIPWMTFGGAEALLYNYGLEIRERFNLSFITGLPSDNEWGYKFRELTDRIYHLPNLFDDERLYLEFVSHYIATRQIEIMHIVHNGFMFELLPELRRRHPGLKILVTMFNDLVEFFPDSMKHADCVDAYSSDNQRVVDHFKRVLGPDKKAVVIPNGVNCFERFNPELYDRAELRQELGLADDELMVLYIGRLSQEKNPDVFVAAAKRLLATSRAAGVRFFMVGDGPMRPQVEHAIHALGNKTTVTYLGYQTEVPKFLAAADIYVLPSAFEGFPTSVLEAMAMNVAVVASDVGAVSSVIESGRNGFVVTPGSAAEIADGIHRLRQDRQLLAQFKRDSRDLIIAKYSTKVLGQNYARFYNES